MQPKPESEVTELVNLNELPVATLEGHQWRQYGNQLVCQSCPNAHLQFLPPDVYFAGYDDKGIMQFKRRAVSSPVSPPSQG